MGYYDFGKGKRGAIKFLEEEGYKTTKVCPTALLNKEKLTAIISNTTKKALDSDYWSGYNYILKERLGEISAYYGFGECDEYFERKKIQDLNKIVDRESEDYEDLITAQTKKQNTIVMLIGAGVVAIGTLIIFKK